MPRSNLARDVPFVPFFYDMKWSRELNALLGGVFRTPFKVEQFKGYRRHKSYFGWLSRMFDWMHDNRETFPAKVFYGSLNLDFSWNLACEFPGTKHYGICHGTMYDQPDAPKRRQFEANQRPKRWLPFEAGIFAVAEPPFVASEVLARAIPVPTRVVGLPLYGHPKKPSTQNGVLWNHRTAEYKHPELLLRTSTFVRERVIASVPGGAGKWVRLVREGVGEFRLKPTPEQYAEAMARCGFVLSFNSHETFGYSVNEAVWAGLFAFAPRHPSVPYAELLPDEMLFDEPEEIEERLRWFLTRPSEKEKAVLRAQENLAHLRSDRWLATLLGHMELEA